MTGIPQDPPARHRAVAGRFAELTLGTNEWDAPSPVEELPVKTTASTRLSAYSRSEWTLPSTPGSEKSGAAAPRASRGRSPPAQAVIATMATMATMATTATTATTTRRDDTRASWDRIRKTED